MLDEISKKYSIESVKQWPSNFVDLLERKDLTKIKNMEISDMLKKHPDLLQKNSRMKDLEHKGVIALKYFKNSNKEIYQGWLYELNKAKRNYLKKEVQDQISNISAEDKILYWKYFTNNINSSDEIKDFEVKNITDPDVLKFISTDATGTCIRDNNAQYYIAALEDPETIYTSISVNESFVGYMRLFKLQGNEKKGLLLDYLVIEGLQPSLLHEASILAASELTVDLKYEYLLDPKIFTRHALFNMGSASIDRTFEKENIPVKNIGLKITNTGNFIENPKVLFTNPYK